MNGLLPELNVEGSFIIITNAYGVKDSWSLVVTSKHPLYRIEVARSHIKLDMNKNGYKASTRAFITHCTP